MLCGCVAKMKSKMRINSYQSPFSPQAFFNANKLDAILGNVPRKSSRILDVGCGYGTLIQRLEGSGHDCYGVEPDPAAVRVAQEHGLNVKKGVAESIPYPGGHFDVVILTEVIEHLRRPEKAVAEVNRVLKKGGLVIITTPNVMSLWLVIERLWDWYAELDYHHEHFNYFSPRSLPHMLERGGFRIASVSTIQLVSFLLSAASMKAANLAKAVENVVLPKARVGLQLVVTARKF